MKSAPLHHVLVDYENVRAIDLEIVGRKGVRLTLLLGLHEKKLDVELVERLLAHADTVELVRLNAAGKDALDFTLAYYLGRAVASDPTGHFYIIAKDTGYDPMIKHLLSQNIKVARHDDFSKLPLSKTPKAKPVATNGATYPISSDLPDNATRDKYARALEHLRKLPPNRPKNRKRLANSIAGCFGKKTTKRLEIENLIDQLIKDDVIAIDAKGAVTYSLENGHDREAVIEEDLSDPDCDIPF